MKIVDKELAAAVRALRFCTCGHEPVVHDGAKGKCDACTCEGFEDRAAKLKRVKEQMIKDHGETFRKLAR